VKVLYSPMHGVGAASIVPALAQAGFRDVEVFAPHAAPDGDFPNVPGHVANPENPATFDAPIARAQESGAEIVLSTDPDADRLGCAAPLVRGGPWRTFAALLTEYVLASRQRQGRLSREHYVVKTLVTSELVARIAASYGVEVVGDLMVGFKWIAGAMDERGPQRFVFGAEESHGYLVGAYARDKDATVAALLLAELAAAEKAQGRTLHEKLDSLLWQHGCHAERTVSLTMPGSEGMARMGRLMAALRERPPPKLAGQSVRQVRDYAEQVVRLATGKRRPLASPRGEVVVLDLAEGNYVAVRPSGTEPKVKLYQFAFEPPELIANLDDTKAELADRLHAMERDLAAWTEQSA
jgi:phosphomannomutase